MASRFLFNETLWTELATRIPATRRVCAAVAYLGSGGADLLPLREGDQLVVDMSLRTVRAGATDPHEIRKLLGRGVDVFSRGSLHAKFFLLGDVVIAGSANISKRAHEVLDEVALLTDDRAAVRRARATFDQLCTEPVRQEYLAKCLKEYNPPKIALGQAPSATRRGKLVQGKVWIVGGLRYRALPEAEQATVERITRKVARRLRGFQLYEPEYTHYSSKLGFFDLLREDDWLIVCISDGKRYEVFPPARFLRIETYERGNGKLRYLVYRESRAGEKAVPWSIFRAALPAGIDLTAARGPKPRTAPITDDSQADSLLRLWDTQGRFRGKRKA
jgi:hypothetical protein